MPSRRSTDSRWPVRRSGQNPAHICDIRRSFARIGRARVSPYAVQRQTVRAFSHERARDWNLLGKEAARSGRRDGPVWQDRRVRTAGELGGAEAGRGQRVAAHSIDAASTVCTEND
jgi:hypothetical protein